MQFSLAKRAASLAGLGWLGGLALSGCADSRARPTFPEGAAHQTLVEEQGVLGLDAQGDALVAQLIAADGESPQLSLLVFDRDAKPTRTLLVAPAEIARAVAERLVRDGRRHEPLLAAATVALWPEAIARESAERFSPAPPTPPDPGMHRWSVPGAGALPLSMRVAPVASGATADLLMLAEAPGSAPDSDEVELARMPLAGTEVAPQLWIHGSVVWLLAGSVLDSKSEPLHRAVGLRRGSIGRGEAMLHNQHGLADYAAGELDAASKEFERALLADPRFVDALYNAASVAALEDRAEVAVALLRRAADEDPRRVQVLGRDDDDLRLLRQRPDVREILGLVRMPPGE